MNAPCGFRDEWAGVDIRAAGEFGTEIGMSGITGFFIAVGIVSLIIFTMMLRADRLRDRRRAYADSSASDAGGISCSSNDGFNLLNWFGSRSSSSSSDSCTSSSSFFSSGNSSNNESSNSSDSGCSDGGGGGDSVGGGGGD